MYQNLSEKEREATSDKKTHQNRHEQCYNLPEGQKQRLVECRKDYFLNKEEQSKVIKTYIAFFY